MRILKFNVRRQTIRKDPACDFRGLVRGSVGYLSCQFSFDSDWDDLNKVAEFRRAGSDNTVSVLLVDGACEVPDDIASAKRWSVRVVGGKGEKRLRTAACDITQKS